MTRAALTLHLIAVVLTVGPVTVAASLFPPALRAAAAAGQGPGPVAALLHRICRVYGVLGLAVPAFGVITALRLGVMSEAWVLTSAGLTLVAGLVLALVVVPGQRRGLAALGRAEPPAGAVAVSRRLAGATGGFSLLWVAVLALMVFRPGSTLGA